MKRAAVANPYVIMWIRESRTVELRYNYRGQLLSVEIPARLRFTSERRWRRFRRMTSRTALNQALREYFPERT